MLVDIVGKITIRKGAAVPKFLLLGPVPDVGQGVFPFAKVGYLRFPLEHLDALLDSAGFQERLSVQELKPSLFTGSFR